MFGRTKLREIDVLEARRRAETGEAVLVDVRNPGEYVAGHARGARLVPLGELAGRLDELRSAGEILFICASGSRSQDAAHLATRGGLSPVASVAGGTAAWAERGCPVEVGR